MNLLRKYKISKLTGIPLAGTEGKIIKFMNNILKDITTFIDDKQLDIIYYMKDDDKWIFHQDFTRDKFYVRYDKVWVVLENKYKMKNSEIGEFIKYIVEEKFKHKISTPIWFIEYIKRNYKTV